MRELYAELTIYILFVVEVTVKQFKYKDCSSLMHPSKRNSFRVQFLNPVKGINFNICLISNVEYPLLHISRP